MINNTWAKKSGFRYSYSIVTVQLQYSHSTITIRLQDIYSTVHLPYIYSTVTGILTVTVYVQYIYSTGTVTVQLLLQYNYSTVHGRGKEPMADALSADCLAEAFPSSGRSRASGREVWAMVAH